MAGVYACNEVNSPPTAPSTRVGPNGASLVAPTAGVTTVCKVGPGATFQVKVGLNATPQPVTIPGGTCVNVATVNAAAADDVIVSVAENTASYYALDHIMLQHGQSAPSMITGTNSVSFEGAHGAIVTFYNNAIVTVCKSGTNATFQYQIGVGGAMQSLSLNDGQCANIATFGAATADDVIVTVRENMSPSYTLDHMTLGLGNLTPTTITGTNSASFEGLHGAHLTFVNKPVTPPATSGCTFTQGYYKNKGSGLLPSGTFFLSGQTWQAVLDTPPAKGNAYYVLAHQYIAAVLNAKVASVPTSVSAAITGASAYFAKATPSDWSGGGAYSKEQLRAWADLLDAYNSGKVGRGHCD